MPARQPYEPFTSIVVPCLGDAAGAWLERNALALARQDYPEYEVLFVMPEPDDAAYAPLERVRQRAPRVRLVLADPDIVGAWPSRVMVAQLTGVRHAEARSEVLAFADPWTRPGPQWLARLVAPLEDPEVAASTGLRQDPRGLVRQGLAMRRERFARGPFPGPWAEGRAASTDGFGFGLVYASGPVVAVPEEDPAPEPPAPLHAEPMRWAPTAEWG